MHQYKLRTIFIVFVTLSLVILTLVSTGMNVSQFSNLYYKKTEEADLPNAVGRIAEQVRGQLMPALLTAETMADNLLLHDWMRAGEINAPQNQQVMDYFKKQQQDAGASTLFWVSAKTLAYYTEAGHFKQVSRTEPRDQWFFDFIAGQEKQSLTLDPDERNGNLTLFVNTQVRFNNEAVAVTGLGYDVTEIARLITQHKVGENGFLFLVDQDNRITVHRDLALTEQKVAQVNSYQDIQVALSQHKEGFNLHEGRLNNEPVYIAVQSIKGTSLKLIAIQPTGEISRTINRLIFFTVLVSLVLIIIFVVATVIFANSLSRLIRRVGDNLLEMSGQGGDLTHRLDDSFDNELGHLAKGFNAIIARIRVLVAEIQATETAMKNSIEQLANLAQNTFDATEAQRGETDQVATAITEMGQTINEVTGVAHRTAEDTEVAVQDTQQTSQNMDITAQTMEQLNDVMVSIEQTIAEFADQATAIQSFVEIINGISEQTNLLALNAAIEAARAGEQGRGFAVVADEVRNLARRTQESTLEIGEQVSVLQETAQRSTQAIQRGTHNSQEVLSHALEAAQALAQIQQKFDAIRAGNHQVAAATEEQSSVIEHINQSAQSISTSATDIHKNAENQIESIAELQERAEHLRQLVSQFKV